MELYKSHSNSIPQKLVVVLLEIFFLGTAYKVLFGSWGTIIYGWLSMPAPVGNDVRNTVNFIFSCIVFLRMSFMMFFLLKRTMPLEEAISIPFAFSLYYLGFAVFTVSSSTRFMESTFSALHFSLLDLSLIHFLNYSGISGRANQRIQAGFIPRDCSDTPCI
jgi:hypothetical protein